MNGLQKPQQLPRKHNLSGATGRLALLGCVLRCLRREVLEFQFKYPLEVVPEVGPKTPLQYHLYSEGLAWEAMRPDTSGIPRTWTRLTGALYMPGHIAWYGLVNLGHHLRHGDRTSLDVFGSRSMGSNSTRFFVRTVPPYRL